MVAPVSNVVKQIYDQLDHDPRTKGAVIEVSFNQGIVVLSGTVKSSKVAEAAEEIARGQSGVVSVMSELKISS